MCGGGNRLGGSQAGADTPVKPSEAAGAVGKGLCCYAEGGSRPVIGLSGFATDDLSSGDAVIGAETEPGHKVLFRGELSRVEAHLGDDLLHGKGVKAGYLGEVDTAHPVELGPEVNERLVLDQLFPLPFRTGKRVLDKVDLRVKRVEVALYFQVTGFYLPMVEVIELDRLLEGEEMFFR